MKSKVEEWFEGEYGKRPSRLDIADLQFKMISLKMDYAKAERLYLDTQRWDGEHDAALKAWKASSPS